MENIKIITVVGARPQFVKAAALSRAIARHNASAACKLDETIVHTGQHYDDNMSRVFFEELEIPAPAINFGVGSGSHGAQTAAMLAGIEKLLMERRPDLVLVYGDTNSTLAGALAAAKLHIPVAHVEAGLRSYDRRMPEEINRVLTDTVADLLLCPTQSAVQNLQKEGILRGVQFVGDVMYDSVLYNLELARRRSTILERLNLQAGSYYLATVHRAENTDQPQRLAAILRSMGSLGRTVVLPIHPRARAVLGSGADSLDHSIKVIEPVGYLDMLALQASAGMILTDSGGVQKEAYWLKVPCVVLREQTEWVELVQSGAAELAGATCEGIIKAVRHFETLPVEPESFDGRFFGDGKSADAIVRLLSSRQRPAQ